MPCQMWLLLPLAAYAQDLFLPREMLTPKAKPGGLVMPTFRVFHNGTFGNSFTGRVRLHISTRPAESPSELLFGKDVSDWKAGEPAVFAPGDEAVFGFPAADLADLSQHVQPGDTLYVQAELVVYDLYKRRGMPPTWLPTSCVSKAGNDGAYDKPDGTLLSDVTQLQISSEHMDVQLNQKVPDSTPQSPGCAGLGDAVDSAWIKTVRIKSSLLSDFWGRSVTLEACVLLPWGFDEHPEAKYPLVVAHGHYSAQFMPGGGFQETMPTCAASSNYSCYSQHDAHKLYTDWTDPKGPFEGARALVMTVNHPVPFFDDSYAVNSANMGPYGDAIVHELIPAVEQKYRGLGQGWARGLLGGSTGGWETIAQQVFYPDEFNGMLAACPDPVTFTSYVNTNIYQSRNYFFYDDKWLKRPRPAMRDHYSGQAFQDGKGPAFVDSYGQITQTTEEANHQELAQGTHSRSCGQWDIWEATFSPACPDGFPCRLYDKRTGEINKTIAQHWKDHFDLAHIIERDWVTLRPKLKGKMRIAVGGSDTFYLTNAVMDLKNVLERLGSDAEVTIGSHEGIGYQHCFNGYLYDREGKVLPNAVTRNYYLQMNIPVFAKNWVNSAPQTADITSWRY
eukprot:gnl/MRDRNA2_/MRDRNA2_20246_c0_seq1.p1 gnl/MRDRNA2_/MRDRNA2_20246_c0~~gnl/MRDRNA2_/MRDRNA2_20246_c0_seq1.p1  ORF type:complete len:618 (+),score=113.67 gnl/MRDRNA2_/MRDRNA2_20246_c0_seq1:69-1922(+)